MKSRKEILTEKYNFEYNRLFENKAGKEKITYKQIRFISMISKFAKNDVMLSEICKMYELYNLPKKIEKMTKSQAMFLIHHLLYTKSR